MKYKSCCYYESCESSRRNCNSSLVCIYTFSRIHTRYSLPHRKTVSLSLRTQSSQSFSTSHHIPQRFELFSVHERKPRNKMQIRPSHQESNPPQLGVNPITKVSHETLLKARNNACIIVSQPTTLIIPAYLYTAPPVAFTSRHRQENNAAGRALRPTAMESSAAIHSPRKQIAISIFHQTAVCITARRGEGGGQNSRGHVPMCAWGRAV